MSLAFRNTTERFRHAQAPHHQRLTPPFRGLCLRLPVVARWRTGLQKRRHLDTIPTKLAEKSDWVSLYIVTGLDSGEASSILYLEIARMGGF